ncbi:MAG TPA: ATP-binding protein [Acidimicrobiales bacterium]|nr:ATP-binding protein [Acidimicrobiales bacterium]
MRSTRSFTAGPASIGAARRFASDSLPELPPDALDAVVLMVSELATNCIRFTPGAFSISIEDDTRSTRVDVTDRGGGKPTVRSPRATDLSGRGLQIVEAMSDDWGVVPAKSCPGTTVWFTLGHRENPADKPGLRPLPLAD